MYNNSSVSRAIKGLFIYRNVESTASLNTGASKMFYSSSFRCSLSINKGAVNQRDIAAGFNGCVQKFDGGSALCLRLNMHHQRKQSEKKTNKTVHIPLCFP